MNRRWTLGLVVGVAAAWGAIYAPLFAGEVLAGRDLFRLAIPDSAFLLECLHARQWPFWIPYLRMGEPFFAAIQTQALYPPRLVSVLVGGAIRGPTVQHLLQVLIAFAGMWKLARALGQSRIAATLSAGSFAFSLWYTVLADEPNMSAAIAWSGWIGLAARRRSSLALSLLFALSFLAGSPEVTLMQGVLALVLASLRRRPGAGLRRVVLGAAHAACLCAVMLIPALELAAHSDRKSLTLENRMEWSTSWSQLVNTVWIGADAPLPTEYFGEDQRILLSAVVGTVLGALALLGASVRRRGRRLAVLAAVFALLSLGGHLAASRYLLSLPVLNTFRYPGKYLTLVFTCMSLLAGLGVDRLGAWARHRPRTARDAAAFAAGLLLFFLSGSAAIFMLHARTGAPAGLRWCIAWLAILGGATLALPDAMRGRRARQLAVGIAFLELAALHGLVGPAGVVPFEALARRSRILALLPLDGHERLSVTGAPPGFSSGMTAAELTEFLAQTRDRLELDLPVLDRVRLVEGLHTPAPERINEFFATGESAYALAAVRSFVLPVEAPALSALRAISLPQDAKRSAFTWNGGLSRVTLVHRARLMDDAAVLLALSKRLTPIRTETLLAEGQPLEGEACSDDRVAWREDSPNRVTVEVETCRAGYLRLADTFYPGWCATVDGIPVPIQRADYTLRAVKVGPGRHVVNFQYQPRTLAPGLALSGAAVLMAVALLVRRRRRAGRAEPAAGDSPIERSRRSW